MIEFTKDLIHRAWLIEDINAESSLVEIEYHNYDGTAEKLLAQVKRHEKLPNGKYKWFEIGTTHPCLIDGEQAYYMDTEEYYTGEVFTLNVKKGIYTRKDELGTGTATILDKNAKFYRSYMLRETIFRQVPEFVMKNKETTDVEKNEQIKKIQEHIRLTTYKDYMENETERNRILEQKKFDERMVADFPGQWLAEYTPLY